MRKSRGQEENRSWVRKEGRVPSGVGVERRLARAALRVTWLRLGPGGGQTMEASSGGCVPRRGRRGPLITCAGGSSGSAGTPGALKNTPAHHAATLRRRTARLPAPTARPLPPPRGPAWKGSKARLPGLLKLFCSPFPRPQQQWSRAPESGSRAASPGLAPAAALPAPRTRPPSVNPAPRERHCGPPPARGEARDPAAPRGACPGAARPRGAALTFPTDAQGPPRPEAHPK